VSEKTALYVRVSSVGQDLDGQERELREEARRRDWDIVETYKEKITATGRVERKEYDRLQRDLESSSRSWTILLVWALDRYSRDFWFSKAIDAVLTLESKGVKFKSLTEPELSTPDDGKESMSRDMILAIKPVIAKWEVMRIKRRTQLAMDEFKSGRRKTQSGRAWHRVSRLDDSTIEKMRELRDDGKSFREIGRLLDVGEGSVRRAIKRLEKKR